MKFSTAKEKNRHEIRKITGTIQGVLGYSGGRGSVTGGYHGYEYNCTVIGSGKEITCCRDEFEFVD